MQCTALWSALHSTVHFNARNWTALHSAPLCYAVMHSASLNCSALQSVLCRALYCALHFVALHCTVQCIVHIALQCIMHCFALCTALCTAHYTILHCEMHRSALHCEMQCSTQCTALHCTLHRTVHCTVLHCTALFCFIDIIYLQYILPKSPIKMFFKNCRLISPEWIAKSTRMVMVELPPRLIVVSKLYDCCTAIRSGGVIAVWFVVWLAVWFLYDFWSRINFTITRFNHVI